MRTTRSQSIGQNRISLIVTDYFKMLELELLGQPYRKSDHREEIATKLQNRSSGSIEFKHQNVSGVLVELGLPYIEGYKPRRQLSGNTCQRGRELS